MANPIGRPDPNHCSPNDDDRSLKYAFDAGFVSGANPSNDGDSASRLSPDSESSGESKRLGDLAASFRVFSESMLRMEQAELEMVKAREAARLAAEMRRAESETELTRMLVQTQLQIASFFIRTSPGRKRKRSDGTDHSSNSAMEGNMLLSLLQFNLM
ncbi:hypothetical protein CEY00_Acc24994 [Actinidia chinensis var. chinensis]|uniref:Uncharacterized protein n=1 Tax=Actinidia chinensis var. chinensis TaxID=1590841 RepID=A0A2R6PXD0_ACTCC|nr:hypothetical protein CEY00_Acc24994 [Actinidia chinensis var. chinensis]